MIRATWKMQGIYKADANLVANEIASIKNATAENILEIAKNPDSELHKCFTWDNNIAAEKWRLHEARQIVCNLHIAKSDKKQESTKIRMFYKTDNNGYKPVTLIVNNEDEYQSLLRRAYEELKNFKKKYSRLNELQEIFELIDNL